MCGIVAMFSQHGSIAGEALEKATQSLYHRGPDGQRHWIAPDRRVGLGHARLSIIDLATGDQPIANEDETLRIIVNGEFYGYEAIQQELEEAGHRLRTRSDSEIALHLYEELGAHCLHRLRGEFAIVLWDSVNRTLFAARDRFGIKPLFYAFHEGTLYLASEVKALLAAGVPRRWDGESVYDSGGFGGDQTRTLFAGVKYVPPGHYLVASETDIQLKRYWDFDYPPAMSGGRVRSDAEYAEEFRSVFEEAVRLRLRADVPVGCYLSGGIDSCAVLGFAARHHRGPIRAFTLAFDRPEYNESEIAREMAAKAEAEFFPIPIRQDQLADEFSDAILQSETLCVNAHGVAKYLLSRAVRDAGYKVVLTGEGSDEILGGYLHFRRDMPGNGQPVPAASLQRLQSFPPGTTPGNGNGHGQDLGSIRQLLGFVPGWMEASAALSAKMRGLLARDFVERFAGWDGCRGLLNDLDVPGQLAGRDALHQSLYLWSKTRLPKYLLTLLGDRMEMAHSVEGRVPFLDHRLVEVARSQPVNQKIHGATQKYVLREAVRNMVTETAYRRPKHPFLSPPLMLNPRGRFSVLLQDMLRGAVLASMPFFDQKKVVSVLDGLQTADESSRVANDQVLMMVLSACVLHHRLRLSA
ncbi:MAG TPA: asparagine synthase (glutamine-hydrolyzing) [Terriglobales bacterium]|nr:asparagine synthase (glutamine-hydrolyzing) [Terriglobales bacterium]